MRKFVVLTTVFSFAFSGCGKSTYYLKNLTSFPPSCTTKVLDQGSKSAAYTRAQYADVKMIPGTHYPAVAFGDLAAYVMKFSYWDGSKFTTEIIAGDYSAVGVRIAFLSTGIPFVFWVSGGTNLKVAVRSAALTSPGTWTAAVIDSGTTASALEVAVNPLDQIGVIYLTDTAVTGRARFIYCSSCTSPTSFTTMSPSAYIEDTNLIANETAVGMGWCKVNDASYYPAVAYSVTGNTRFAICRDTLSDCSTTANWTTQTVVASGNTATKLLLDPTVTGDVPKVISQGGSGIVTYSMGSACTGAPAAFSSGATLGGASSGTLGLELMKDPTGKFHVVANEGTTSVRYYNSEGTDFTGSWNSAGILESITLSAALWMGAALDANTNGIFATYGITNASANLRVTRINDYTLESDSGSFSTSKLEVDTTGVIMSPGAPRRNVTAATTSQGIPAAAYIDYSGSVPILRYTWRGGTSASSSWMSCTIPNPSTPQTPSLAYDASDRPWVSYYDSGLNRFFVVTNAAADCSGGWIAYEFPWVPAGAQGALPAVNDSAITMYTSEGTQYVMMGVLGTNASDLVVRAAYLNPSTLKWSAPVTVGNLGSSRAGNIHVAADGYADAGLIYQDLTLNRLMYTGTNTGDTWSTPVAVSGSGQGMGARIAFDPKTRFPMVSYFDRSGNRVTISSCSAAGANCGTVGWNTTQVDGSVGVSGLTSATDQLLSASIVFSTFDLPYVVYPRGRGSDGNLVATLIRPTSTESNIIANGVNPNLPDSQAVNFGIAGWSVATTPNYSGLFTSVYIGPGNWLYATSCGD